MSSTDVISTPRKRIAPMESKRVIYALRCPLTNGIRYIGLTRNPKVRRSMHRSRKKNPYTLVDKWTADCAAAGRPVKWQTVAVINSEFASIAIAIEEAIIAKLKRNGCDLLNADLDEIRSRKRPANFPPQMVYRLSELLSSQQKQD